MLNGKFAKLREADDTCCGAGNSNAGVLDWRVAVGDTIRRVYFIIRFRMLLFSYRCKLLIYNSLISDTSFILLRQAC